MSRSATSPAYPDTQVVESVRTHGHPPTHSHLYVCVGAVNDNAAGRNCVNCVCTHCGHHDEVKDGPSNRDGALCSAAAGTQPAGVTQPGPALGEAAKKDAPKADTDGGGAVVIALVVVVAVLVLALGAAGVFLCVQTVADCPLARLRPRPRRRLRRLHVV